MMKRKIPALLLAGIMLTGATGAAFAEEKDMAIVPISAPISEGVDANDAALTEAILKVKGRITIPAELEEFNFYKGTTNGHTYYELQWWSEAGTYRSVSVRVQGDVITSYSSYDYGDKLDGAQAGFAKLTNDQLYKKAVAHVKQLNPDIYTSIVIDKDSFSSSVTGTNASFTMHRYENGVRVSGDSGHISMNKDTGELVSYSQGWAGALTLAKPEGALSAGDIQAAYADLIGLMPVYHINTVYDGNKRERTAVLLYTPKSSENLDALTGKISSFEPNYYGSWGWGGDEDGEAADDMGAGSSGLTEKELAAVEKEKGLISAADAAKIVAEDKYIALPDSVELRSSSLSNDYYDPDNYIWNLYLHHKDTGTASVSLDARTGEILSFYVSSNNQTEVDVRKKTADSNVEKALKHYLGDRFSQYRLNTSDDYKEWRAVEDGTKYSDVLVGYSYAYDRYVNGVKVEGDTIYATTGEDNKLRRFSFTHTDVEFPSTAEMLSETMALSSLFEQQQLELGYYINMTSKGKATTALLYAMDYFYLDAFSGKLTDYTGAEISTTNGYSDIEGHSIKKIAEKLRENGITLYADGGKLLPDEKITEADFITLMTSIFGYNSEFYAIYQSSGVRLTIAERAAGKTTSTAKTITRRDAVKCFVTALGGRQFAELGGIYKSPYADVADSDGYAGYFAIADSLGITSANSAGKVLPKNTITRAQALRMVYGYLNG